MVSSSLPQVAISDIREAVQDADLLVFVVPHQFIHRICEEITGKVPKEALGITLIKVAPYDPRQEKQCYMLVLGNLISSYFHLLE